MLRARFFYGAEGPSGISLTHNDSGPNFHYNRALQTNLCPINIVQLSWKLLNYVLNYLLLGNEHCYLLRSFDLF